MKGKIKYFAKIEKEIEIPDRLIELNEKDWDRTPEEDKERDIMIETLLGMMEKEDPAFHELINITYKSNQALIEP